MKVIVTAGFDRSPSALAMAEILRRDTFDIAGIVVVRPLQPARIASMLRRIGPGDLLALTRKLAGRRSQGPLSRFLERSGIRNQSLGDWARSTGTPLHRARDINDRSVVEFLRSRNPDWIVYGGGGILRTNILAGGTWRVINAHLGPLPDIRGMNAAEWSVLMGLQPTATIHLIDEGIDTGTVLGSGAIDLTGINATEDLRQQAVVTGIETIVRTLSSIRADGIPTGQKHGVVHRQCFTLSPALKEILEQRLATISRRP